jgi:hypothetical protein
MDKLVSTLNILKNQLGRWQQEVNDYGNWIFDNSEIDSFNEREKIEKIKV